MSPYPQFDDALRRAAADLVGRGFRIAMVQLGWDAAKGEKTMIRTPPAKWQSAAPMTAEDIQPAIDGGANAYLWRLPDGWWVVDADTEKLTEEYTRLLGSPDVVTPRGAHWVVDAPAKRLHKLDTGVRAFYGPSSFYPGGDGRLRAYVGVVPDRPRALPAQLRRTATEYGELAPGEAAVLEPGAAAYTESTRRTAWLVSVHGGRHNAMIDYLPQLARLLRVRGMSWEEVADQLMLAVQAHPEYDDGWFDDEAGGSAGGAVASALGYAVSGPWKLGVKPGFDERFVPPDPGDAPGDPATSGAFDPDGDDPFAFTDEDYDDTRELPEPVFGGFGGSKQLFYADKVHWLQGESDSGKSWVALAVLVDVVRTGAASWVLDYENSRAEFAGRLRALGITREEMRRVAYVAGDALTFSQLREYIAVHGAGRQLLVVDGVTSALSAMGKSGRDEQEFGQWFDAVPAKAPMAICVDHVVKSTDDRQGMAIGTQAKKGRPDVAFEVRCVVRFGRGRSGAVELVLQKDRHSGLGMVKGDRVRVAVESTDDGRKVVLAAAEGSAAASFFGVDATEELAFAALYAEGMDAGIGQMELWRACKQHLYTYSTAGHVKREKLDAWRKYYSERQPDYAPGDSST